MTHASESRKTPEQREREAEAQELMALKRKEAAGAIGRAFATADGRVALRAIMDKCHYQTQLTVTSVTGIDEKGTQHNVALRDHYIWLRKQIGRETLIAVEIDKEER